jgi:hypothetical protein
MQRFLRLSIATLFLGFGISACGDDDDDDKSDACIADCGSDGGEDAGGGGNKDAGGGGNDESIEIAGDWDNQFKMEEVISDTMWAQFKMISFDNKTNTAITQNAKDDKYNPGKFNKTLWTEPTDDGFAYCMFAFGKETAADAQKAKNTADQHDLDKGCGGFEWTKLTPHKEGGGGEDAGNDLDAGN